MYTIGNIIYGVPLTRTADDAEGRTSREKYDELMEKFREFEEKGFLEFYSGCSPVSPAAFGVFIPQKVRLSSRDEVDNHIADCTDYIEVNEMRVVPTKKEVAEYNKHFKALPNELKELVIKFGPPRVIILWSTS